MARVETVTSNDIESKVLRVRGPVVLDFYQASCPPCHVLEPRLERVAAQYRGRVPVFRVDIDRGLAVAERFRVMSIPPVLVLRDSREVERLDGFINEPDLTAVFERASRA